MDRRNLLVSESAAVASWPTLTSTADHARRVLGEVNAGLGLVGPAGLRRRFEQGHAAMLASEPRDPEAADLDAWIRWRLVELCGTNSYAIAATEIPQTRSLLAFSFLAFSQHQLTALPQLSQGMRVPTVLRALEPDFLPVLLSQIEDQSITSRDFATALCATSAELDPMIDGAMAALPGNSRQALEFAAGVVVFIAFLYWVERALK